MMTVANVEMAKAWDGEEGDRWTEQAEYYESAGIRAWRRFLDEGFIATGDAVLDVGCGTGKSTRDAARLAAPGPVLGVDLSARMLELARSRSAEEGLANVEFVQADAQVHPFAEGAFDVAISSFGAMFFDDPVAAFANIATALRPGGRLALLAWRDLARNEWVTAIRDALAAGRALPPPPAGAPGPFAMAGADHARAVLGDAGFSAVDLVSVDEPMCFGRNPADAWRFVRTIGIVKGLTEDLDAATRARVLDEVQAVLAAHAGPDGVLFASSAWLVTARRPPA